MKKIKLFLMAVMAVACLGTFAQQKKIALLTAGIGTQAYDEASDARFMQVFGDKYVVEPIAPSTAYSADLYASYDLIVIHPTVGGADPHLMSLKELVGEKPILNLKSFCYQNNRWSWSTAANASNTSLTKIAVETSLQNHPAFKDLTFTGGELALYSGDALPAVNAISSVLALPFTGTGWNQDWNVHNHQLTSFDGGKVQMHELNLKNAAKYILFAISTEVGALASLSDDAIKLMQNTVEYLLDPTAGYFLPPTVEVASPVVEIVYNSATNAKTVTITCETAGAQIYYTTDGTNPTKESTLYAGPFEMTAESFTIKSRAWVGEDASINFGEKSWTDPSSFDTTAEYYVYSNGADEAGGGQNRMTSGLYIYAASETSVNWKDSTEVDFSSTDVKWKLALSEGLVTFQNMGNNAYLAKGSIAYIDPTDETEKSVASLVLNATGDAFYVKQITTAEKRPWTTVHAIQFSETDNHCFEVNNGVKEGLTKEGVTVPNTLAKTIQINNTYAERARFHWVIEKVPGTGAGVNETSIDKDMRYELFFDVMGRQVTGPIQGAITICKTIYTDGTVKTQKLFVK